MKRAGAAIAWPTHAPRSTGAGRLRGDDIGAANGRFGRTWQPQRFAPVTDGPSAGLQANWKIGTEVTTPMAG